MKLCFVVVALVLFHLASGSHIRKFAEDAFRPNQYLVFDDDDTSILFDTGFGNSVNTDALIKFIGSQGVTSLQTIFITHGHPDHYGGLPALLTEFPFARAEMGSQAAIDELVANAQFSFPDSTFDWANAIRVHDDDEFFDEVDLLLLTDFPAGESDNYSMIHNADENYIITGDALNIDYHAYLGPSVNQQKLQNWYGYTLEAINDGGILGLDRNTRYYPGHGPPGDSRYVTEFIDYLKEFEDTLLTCPNTETPISLQRVADNLLAEYPEYEGEELLDFISINPAWEAAQTRANPCGNPIYDGIFDDDESSAAIVSLFSIVMLVMLVL